jgi:DNA-binding CsgD family transcriptional regulator
VGETRPPGARSAIPSSDRELERWRAQLATLSGRQRETLALLATGLPAHRIAAALGVSEPTVKSHLQQVYRKLGVTNRVEACMRYLQAGGLDHFTA